MDERFSLEQIRDYWNQQAEKYQTSYAASWSDTYAIQLEIRELAKHLNPNEKVLDIGCANGYTTLELARHIPLDIRGVDYIPEMIEQAEANLAALRSSIPGDVSFGVGDITDLDEPDTHYDTVIVVRVIINLHDWENQVKGLRECIRVLKPGGTLLLSEATVQGWQKLNDFRREWGMTDIPMPKFNLYLDQEQVVEAVQDELELVEIVNFASTYFVGTRVLKPLLIEASGAKVDVANPDSEWNRWFAQLPAAGDYGTQKLFIFRKHD